LTTQKERAQVRRAEKLAHVQEQVASGRMTVTQMSPDELAEAQQRAAARRAQPVRRAV
jgi:hypothetical protein